MRDHEIAGLDVLGTSWTVHYKTNEQDAAEQADDRFHDLFPTFKISPLAVHRRGCYSYTTNYTGLRFEAFEIEPYISNRDHRRTSHPIDYVQGAVYQHKLVSMGTERNQANSGRGFWRSLISAVAIYALIMQPLLIAIVGAQPAQASALDDASLSQLCLHQTDGSPVSPADQQKHPAEDHCLLCFAGAFHLLGAPAPTSVTSIDPEVRKLRQAMRSPGPTSSFLYSIARPRGPPLNA